MPVVGAAPESMPGPSLETQSACREICSRSDALHCVHADECSRNCLAMASLTPCTTEIVAMQRCLTKQPVKNWECAEDGVAAVREGFCDSEQQRAVACMDAKMK